jgi:hypothetical protein
MQLPHSFLASSPAHAGLLGKRCTLDEPPRQLVSAAPAHRPGSTVGLAAKDAQLAERSDPLPCEPILHGAGPDIAKDAECPGGALAEAPSGSDTFDATAALHEDLVAWRARARERWQADAKTLTECPQQPGSMSANKQSPGQTSRVASSPAASHPGARFDQPGPSAPHLRGHAEEQVPTDDAGQLVECRICYNAIDTALVRSLQMSHLYNLLWLEMVVLFSECILNNLGDHLGSPYISQSVSR